MSVIYGLTPQGFVKKTATVIKADLEARFKAGPLGASAGSEPDGSIPPQSLAGQLVGIMIDAAAAGQDLTQAVWAAFNPASASGNSLDALCAITGTLRAPARQSTAKITCTGSPGTVLQPGRVVTVLVTLVRFDSLALATIAALAAWQATHGYVVGDRVTNSARAYVCITAGTSAGAGGPTTTADDITDGGVHWRYLGEGTGAVDVPFQAEQAGAFGALSGQLATIATPVSGWQSAKNLLDATVGQLKETDAALRMRREAELVAAGRSVHAAIRAAVLEVGAGTANPVTSCHVFHNDGDTTDGDGLPPHSVEVLVLGGDDLAVAQAIANEVAAGIQTHGTSPVVVTDPSGQPQTIHFTRPSEIAIWIIVTLTYDATPWPVDGVAQAKADIVADGALYTVGRDVTAWKVGSTLDEVAGVLNVSQVLIGTVNPPVASTTISIGPRQLARFDTSRITVNATPGTP